jgi:hypothetical protein
MSNHIRSFVSDVLFIVVVNCKAERFVEGEPIIDEIPKTIETGLCVIKKMFNKMRICVA